MARGRGSFAQSMCDVRSAMGWTQDQMGGRLGVSRRTLTRWECHDELPPIGVRKHIATALWDAPANLRMALVRALGLDDAFVEAVIAPRAVPAPPPPPPAPELIDGAFLELCERANVAPGQLRAALADFLRRADASGFSMASACVALERRAPAKQRRA